MIIGIWTFKKILTRHRIFFSFYFWQWMFSSQINEIWFSILWEWLGWKYMKCFDHYIMKSYMPVCIWLMRVRTILWFAVRWFWNIMTCMWSRHICSKPRLCQNDEKVCHDITMQIMPVTHCEVSQCMVPLVLLCMCP